MLACGAELRCLHPFVFFFFNYTATPEIYPLSLHDALPISTAPGSDKVAASRQALPRQSTRPLAQFLPRQAGQQFVLQSAAPRANAQPELTQQANQKH